eukprot:SM000045S16178  [mRNA]  locus=s45:121376:122412:+ [translate_table: standard]
MEAYLRHLRTLRAQMNGAPQHEDKAAAINSERHEQQTAISTLEKDIAQVATNSKLLDDRMNTVTQEIRQLQSEVIACHKGISMCEVDSESLAQALDLLTKETAEQQGSIADKRLFYKQVEEEMREQLNKYKTHTYRGTEQQMIA